MNSFDEKIIKLQNKLSFFEHYYGYNNVEACRLREKLKLYRQVREMSYEEVGESIEHAAGEIAKSKMGYYANKVNVAEDKHLLMVLAERIKAEKEEAKRNENLACIED